MNCERPQVIEAQAPQIVGLLGIERELAASCSPVILKSSMDDNEDVQVSTVTDRDGVFYFFGQAS